LYAIATITAAALMFCLPRLGYDIKEDFIFISFDYAFNFSDYFCNRFYNSY